MTRQRFPWFSSNSLMFLGMSLKPMFTSVSTKALIASGISGVVGVGMGDVDDVEGEGEVEEGEEDGCLLLSDREAMEVLIEFGREVEEVISTTSKESQSKDLLSMTTSFGTSEVMAVVFDATSTAGELGGGVGVGVVIGAGAAGAGAGGEDGVAAVVVADCCCCRDALRSSGIIASKRVVAAGETLVREGRTC